MYELKFEEMNKISHYYENATDSCIYSVLQGYMGRAFVDARETCKMAMLLQGDFVYPSTKDELFDECIASSMLEDLKRLSNYKELLYIPQSKAWHQYLLENESFQVIKRYTLSKMKLSDFNQSVLMELANRLPEEYRFERIDEKLYDLAKTMEWSEDNVNNFSSGQEFVSRGLGIVIMRGDELVCAASSYTAYREGIEVEIATKPEYRQRGLASMCGARLILECLKENKIPNWDAANMNSVQIAKKLGYTFLGEYDTFILK